jgi:GT2 family glycosyltransferase
VVRPPFGTWVTGNRWDAVDGRSPDPLPTVSVVVTHFSQPRELERTLHALSRQDYPAALVQVIVADDGSPHPPTVPPGVELVRQDDRGFRAAAARNLGAGRARGDVLCFLDADTSPEPGYLPAITRLPALLPEAVTVGRRRHADFTGVTADAPVEVAGPAAELDEPGWLTEGYRRSRNLLDADDRSYRYVISAALACSRWFFETTGGFDERFDSYGGEDWEWAWRAWQDGGILAHVDDAVAWHDGPEWGGRMTDAAQRRRAGNTQTLHLTRAIPVDGSRGRGVATGVPDVVFRLHGRHSRAATFVCVDSLLAAFPRARVEVETGSSAREFAGDPRVGPPAGADPEARVAVKLERPVALLGASASALADSIRSLGSGDTGRLEIRSEAGDVIARAESRRSRVRRARWETDAGFVERSLALPEAVVLGAEPNVEAYVGGWGGAQQLT